MTVAIDWPTGTDVVRVTLHDRVAVIMFNRPDRRNALHPEMRAPITRALDEFAVRDDIGCIVMTGAGTAFCAGGDVKGDVAERAALDVDARVAALLADAQLAQILHEHPKLTVAAVNGPAVGAGMALALACDFRIAAESARLVTGWARLAFSGDFGGAWFLTRLLGPSRALELLVSNAALDVRRRAHARAGEPRRARRRVRRRLDGVGARAGIRAHGRVHGHEGQRARRAAPVAGRGAAPRDRAHGRFGWHRRPP